MKLLSSLKDLVKNPWLILPSLLLFGVLSLLQFISYKVVPHLQNSLTATVWFIIFTVLVLVAGSFFLSIMMGLYAFGKNPLSYSKYTLRNFVIIALTLIVGSALLMPQYGLSSLIAFLTLPFLGQFSVIILFLLIAASLLGVLIFMSFASVFCVVKNLGIISSFKHSIHFVKKNYLSVLSMILFFFVLYAILSFISLQSIIISDIIHWLLVFPWFIRVLTKFVKQ
ncbi:hypothetical protein KW805_04545 [Candidatus Pacearchaeota archaeon]|nr:hypothetical protein [Candidatus Pacearchaeota archaeon]